MRRPLLLLSPLLLLAALLVTAPVRALDATALQGRLADLHADLGSSAGAAVFDLTTGRGLYSHAPDLALTPASNEKLFVTAAALLRFGVDGTLTTSLHAAPGAAIEHGGRLPGDLYLVGGGDPSLDDRGLQALVTGLKAAGVRQIAGGVRGDESLFDTLRGGPDSAFGPDADLGGVLSALSWRHGASGRGGPAAAAARRLGALLRAAGIRYGRRPRAGRRPDLPSSVRGGGTIVDAAPLASWSSTDMLTLVTATNVPSENFYAEMLTKVLGATFGASGSTAGGLAVVRSTLARLGVAPQLADGSGLSRQDRTSARQILRLLVAMDAQPVGRSWETSLPVAGVSGTLRHRMRGTAAARRCAAKTGTLIGVSALSGFCTTTGGHRVAFSFIENRVCTTCAKHIEDRMVAAIAGLRD